MKTKHFCAAIEAGFQKGYGTFDTVFHTVPYADKTTGEVSECLGILLDKTEHFAVVTAHASHWIAADPDNLFESVRQDYGDNSDGESAAILDLLEDFMNIVSGMKIAPFMQWTCVYFPDLTEEQVLGESEAGHDPQLVTDTAVGRDPVSGLIRDGDMMHPTTPEN